MIINLLGQLYHAGAFLPLFIIFLIRLLLGWGQNEWIIGQGYLVGVPECRRLRKIDNIHSRHPTFLKTKPTSLEDNCTRRILNVNEPYVVECLLANFHGLLQVGKLLVTS